MGSCVERKGLLSHYFPPKQGAMRTSQELLSEQSLCAIPHSTLYSGSSLAIVQTRGHTGGEGEQGSDQSNFSYTSHRSDSTILGTRVLTDVHRHRE